MPVGTMNESSQAGIPLTFAPLDNASRQLVQETLRNWRVSAVQNLFAAIRTGREEPSAAIGAWKRYLGLLRSVSPSQKDFQEMLIDSWVICYCILKSVGGPSGGGNPHPAILTSLTAELLFAGSGGKPALAGHSLDLIIGTDEALPVLTHRALVHFPGSADSKTSMRWQCGSETATVTIGDNMTFSVPLPLRNGTHTEGISVTPMDVSSSWCVPILDGESSWFIEEFPPACRVSVEEKQLQKDKFSARLTAAWQLIRNIWPNVIPWFTELVPAFVFISSGDESGTSLSGSLGPGFPIYFSDPANEYLLAENIIHELQHLRFKLFCGPTTHFARMQHAGQYVSPYRPDPRPLSGLHLGLHAFLAVVEFRLALINSLDQTDSMLEELAFLHLRNLVACKILLTEEEFSEPGRVYYHEVVTMLSSQEALVNRLAGPATREHAARRVRSHLSEAAERGGALRLSARQYADLTSADLVGVMSGLAA